MPTTTMSKRKQTSQNFSKPAEPFVPAELKQPPASAARGVDMTPSKKLAKECVGVRLHFNWFSTSRQVDKDSKGTMADAVGASNDGFSASKRLMDSKHPAIKEANELRRRIEGYWRSMSVPLAAFSGGASRPEAGVRLIGREKVVEFDSRMQSFQPEVKAVQDKVNAAMPDIKNMDSKRLKGLYDPADYPSTARLDFSWGYLDVDVPRALEQIAPQVYQREIDKLNQRMEDTYELATTTMLQELLDVVQSWNDALAPVTRLYPPSGHSLRALHGDELRRKITHADDPSVPEGQINIVVRSKFKKGEPAIDQTLVLNSAKEFADLNPSQVAEEKRVFKNSTVEGMTAFLAHFRNTAGTVNTGAEFNAIVQKIEQHLAQCSTAQSAAEELRSSTVFRNQTHAMMQELGKTVTDQIEILRRPRRRIDRNIIAENKG